jgi:hypothetical protein
MAKNTGVDFILSEDNDLIIGTNGDYLDTDIFEKANNYDVNYYEGYIIIRQFIALCIETILGRYNPFDHNFGASAKTLISTTKQNAFDDFTSHLTDQLLLDDRIFAVNSINYNNVSDNEWQIFVSVNSIASNSSSSFVFPYVSKP